MANLPSTGSADSTSSRQRPPILSRLAQPEPFDPTELLTRVWKQSLPLFRERVAFLEAVALQAQAGTLTGVDRTEAFNIAHKLAGSLGMFGYPHGTEISQQLEVLLNGDNPLDPPTLTRLAADLRASVPL